MRKGGSQLVSEIRNVVVSGARDVLKYLPLVKICPQLGYVIYTIAPPAIPLLALDATRICKFLQNTILNLFALDDTDSLFGGNTFAKRPQSGLYVSVASLHYPISAVVTEVPTEDVEELSHAEVSSLLCCEDNQGLGCLGC